MTATCRWHGISGWAYDYEVHPFGTSLNSVPGNYIVVRQMPSGQWMPLYVGEADDLGDRCKTGHEKWLGAAIMGATHIHAKVTYGGKSVRCAEETDLRRAWKPPLNDQ